MKLRHKKPLNPYKGQANNDKNEFNDDDFRQQASPHKKNGITPTDQIFKYARILAKFVKTINEDYRMQEEQGDDQGLNPTMEKPGSYDRPQFALDPQVDPFKKQQLKELKQVSKLQPKIQIKDDQKDPKAPSRKKQTPPTPTQSRDPKPTVSQGHPGLDAGGRSGQTGGRSRVDSRPKDAPKSGSQRVQQTRPRGQSLGLSKPPGGRNNQNGGPHPGGLGMASNGNNQINLGNMMGMQGGQGMQGMQNMQAMQNMMAQNPMMNQMNMMGMNGIPNMNGMSQLEMAQMLMRFQNPSLYYGGFPMGMNMGMMGMNMQNMQNNMMFQNRIPQKPAVNLFNEQVSTFKQSSDAQNKDLKKVYPLKRSAFHAAIAYKIYLDKLKRQGRSFESLEDIDPTRSARRIKNNQQQPAKNNKESSARKKR